jgi:hypothetical protein
MWAEYVSFVEYEKFVGERMALGKKAQRQQEASRKAGVRELIEDAEEDDDELDEIDRWEQEMIKYGGVRSKKVDESESSEMNRNYRPAPSEFTEYTRIHGTLAYTAHSSLIHYVCSSRTNCYPVIISRAVSSIHCVS